MEALLFYLLAAVAVIATILAITEKHAVHAIVYLVTSFFALAVVFYLLAAPLVAVFEVIIYAGAIMVLFLFVIMMLDLGHPEKGPFPALREVWPAVLLAGIVLTALVALAGGHRPPPSTAHGALGIREFAVTLFRKYGIAVEVISLQLLFAVVGALYLGRGRPQQIVPPPLRGGGEGEGDPRQQSPPPCPSPLEGEGTSSRQGVS